jgi:hypothetical protein
VAHGAFFWAAISRFDIFWVCKSAGFLSILRNKNHVNLNKTDRSFPQMVIKILFLMSEVLLIDLMILKKLESCVEKFVLNGRIELAFYVHTGSNLTTFGRLKYEKCYVRYM